MDQNLKLKAELEALLQARAMKVEAINMELKKLAGEIGRTLARNDRSIDGIDGGVRLLEGITMLAQDYATKIQERRLTIENSVELRTAMTKALGVPS